MKHDPVLARLAAIKAATIGELKKQWRDLFGSEPPPFNRRYLESRLAYRVQELAYGGLKPDTVKRLEDLGEQLDGGNMDFAKLVEVFERNNVTFVSVTQSFNTTTSMGRLTLNVLLSFAQFEREVTAERIRDKFRASRAKGMYMGGVPPLGYDVKARKLVINKSGAAKIQYIFERFREIGSGTHLLRELAERGIMTRHGKPITKGFLYRVLNNRVYIGDVVHKGNRYPGEHGRPVCEMCALGLLFASDQHAAQRATCRKAR